MLKRNIIRSRENLSRNFLSRYFSYKYHCLPLLVLLISSSSNRLPTSYYNIQRAILLPILNMTSTSSDKHYSEFHIDPPSPFSRRYGSFSLSSSPSCYPCEKQAQGALCRSRCYQNHCMQDSFARARTRPKG